MKSYGEFESSLLRSTESFKDKFMSLLNNMGKAVALIAAAVAALITFTDITFSTLTVSTLVPPLFAMLICSYVIYFSLEDAGEELGKSTEEYLRANERYVNLREKIGGEHIEPLRGFCRRYSEEELDFRRQSLMLSLGISSGELEAFKRGKTDSRKKRRLCRKIAGLKPVNLTPQLVLSRGKDTTHSELSNPEKSKLPKLILKILPSTICMVLTVSIMLSVKDGMTSSDIINGILKLSALPIIGFKGYSAGYYYAKNNLSMWIETKGNILEKFLATVVCTKGQSSESLEETEAEHQKE